MGERTGITWCHHTQNYWWGCTHAGPGCDSCYAEELAHRWGRAAWGPGVPRVRTGQHNRNEVLRWNRKAEAAGERRRVFVNSMSDIFDHEVPQEWREEIWQHVAQCGSLDFLLLTKRIGNAAKMLPERWVERGCPPNVWLGMTCVDTGELVRDVKKLLAIPASVHWISHEPGLGPLVLPAWLYAEGRGEYDYQPINWIVTGGESGAKARPYDLEGLRDLVTQCRTAAVPIFVKQDSGRSPGRQGRIPDDLWVKEFPTARAA
jgi:protein gp37